MTSPMTPAERSLRGQIAAHHSWAHTPDRPARTAKARQAALDRFEKEVDPEGVLMPAERARRAANARKKYFAQLAARSAKARRLRGGATHAAGDRIKLENIQLESPTGTNESAAGSRDGAA